MFGVIKKGSSFLLDLFFPIFCLGCRLEGKWVCDICVKTIPSYAAYTCLKCGAISVKSMLCSACFFDPALDSVYCATSYEDALVQRMVRQLKYEGSAVLAHPIADVMSTTLIIENQYLVIPIPLHLKRRMQRGYNQAALIAKELSRMKNFMFLDALYRSRATRSQVELSREERQKNMQGVFGLRKNVDVRDRAILLIDDVFTTGSTVASAARILKDAGAREVAAFTFAHG